MKYITLVNLLATDGLADEDLTPFDPVAGRRRSRAVSRVSDLRGQVGPDCRARCRVAHRSGEAGGAGRGVGGLEGPGGPRRGLGRAAEYILDVLAKRPQPMPRPHFVPAEIGAKSDALASKR